MLFKNAFIQTLSNGPALSERLLRDLPGTEAFTPCKTHDSSSFGFIPPFELREDDYAVHLNGAVFFAVRDQSRVIPPAAVKELLAARVKEIETFAQRKIYRKEMLQLKDEVIRDMIPGAPLVSKITRGYVSGKLLVLDTASDAVAGSVLALLRNTLQEGIGSLIPTARQIPSYRYGAWVSGKDTPNNFCVGDKVALGNTQYADEKLTATAGITQSDYVKEALSDGMFVSSLEIDWSGSGMDVPYRASFTLKEPHILRKLSWADSALGETENDGHHARLTADAFMLVSDIDAIFRDIGNELGGWEGWGEAESLAA